RRENQDRRHRQPDPQRPTRSKAHPAHRDEQGRCQQDDRGDAGHFPEQRCPGVVDAAMPGDVLRLGERVDDPDSERDGGYRRIEQPVGTGYPANPAAYPTPSRLIPSGLVLVPNRLDAGPLLPTLDVTHEVHRAFGDRPMEPEIISHSPHSAAEGVSRRVDLDWVRIAAFGLLILYHVGM